MHQSPKQAKIISVEQELDVLAHLETSKHATRDQVAFLLSIKAGMRAKEISGLTWTMVTDSGGGIAQSIALPNSIAKGKRGGREIAMNRVLRQFLIRLHDERSELTLPYHRVIFSQKGGGLSANTLAIWFRELYLELGMRGCSSHSGRRTFITRAARKITEAGGSLRDVQMLAGHANLNMTERYIEGSSEAQSRLVDLI